MLQTVSVNVAQCTEWVQLLCFSVRDRDQKTYALSLSYKRVTKHYKIEKLMTNGEEKYAIEDGPRFTSLMDVRIKFTSLMDVRIQFTSLMDVRIKFTSLMDVRIQFTSLWTYVFNSTVS